MKLAQANQTRAGKAFSLRGAELNLSELIRLRHYAKRLQLHSQRVVDTNLIGTTQSHVKGRGLDFDEVRVYQPGDDIRTMDWKITARTGIAHTKIYHEERERPVFIVVDLSASMRFGTRMAFKAVKAAEIAALLAWTTVVRNDRVGGIVFAGQKRCELAPRSRRHGVLRLLQALVAIYHQHVPNEVVADEHYNALANHLQQLIYLIRPGSLVFIISDFYQHDALLEKKLLRLGKHNEVVTVPITDVLELEVPRANRYAISNGKQFSYVDTRNKKVSQAYQDYFRTKQTNLEHFLQKYAIPCWSFRTDDLILEKLRYYLQQS